MCKDGNENNRHKPNGEFESSGKLPGHALINLSADYRFAPGWTALGRVGNLFDKRYATRSALAEHPFAGAGNAFAANPDHYIQRTGGQAKRCPPYPNQKPS